jgi:hypothetical protein
MKSVTAFLCDVLDDIKALESNTIVKIFLQVNNLAVQHVKASRERIQKAPKRSRQDTTLAAFTEAKVYEMRKPVAPVAQVRDFSSLV